MNAGLTGVLASAAILIVVAAGWAVFKSRPWYAFRDWWQRSRWIAWTINAVVVGYLLIQAVRAILDRDLSASFRFAICCAVIFVGAIYTYKALTARRRGAEQ